MASQLPQRNAQANQLMKHFLLPSFVVPKVFSFCISWMEEGLIPYVTMLFSLFGE